MKPVKEAHRALRAQFTRFIAEARVNNSHSRHQIHTGRVLRRQAYSTNPTDQGLLSQGWAAHAEGMACRMTGDRALTLALAFLNNTCYALAEPQCRANLQAWHLTPVYRLLQPCFPTVEPMKLSAWIKRWTTEPTRPRDCAPPEAVVAATEAALAP